MNFLEKLNGIKKESGKTTSEISKLSGIPVGTLNKLFAGQTKNPSVDTVWSVMHCLGHTLDDLLDNLDNTSAIKNSSAPVQTGAEELTDDKKQLLEDYDKLNEDGQSTARDSVHALTFLAKYKKCNSAEFSQEA